ncbi:ATP-dependent DNA helicase PIF1 [Orchesella cincta]|uniref:ATP-dependent DNA helicase n=1 Tax=Orchesella cincta TaxID=48709 RepID=A0A1D2M4E9_ORCCI|nr:ATP-dependent DNA helicase PIF1 [Orchesella cincta]
MTLHNVFRLPPMQYSGPLAALEEGLANTLRVRYRETDLFIIDEISMCGATMFQRIDARLRQLFDRSKPFGGKSILVVGHLRQLPPVGEKIIFKCPDLARQESARSQLVGRNPLWQLFQYYELTEIMRQRNAHAFCKALNNMSEGVMDAQDIQLIKSREVAKSDAPTDAVWLFVTNKECEEFNKSLHLSLGTESIVSTAVDTVTGTYILH